MFIITLYGIITGSQSTYISRAFTNFALVCYQHLAPVDGNCSVVVVGRRVGSYEVVVTRGGSWCGGGFVHQIRTCREEKGGAMGLTK